MLLSELTQYNPISILCHDNPDADALSSGYALYTYFKSLNKDVQLIYSGSFKIQKSNLVKMIELLNIPITYYNKKSVPGLLITVDCQYNAGNVTPIKADTVAIIDHHQQEIFNFPLTHICNYLGSCSTLVWQMLVQENFSFELYPNVATALYYGLYSDTNGFSELFHPLDRDMRDSLHPDQELIKRLRNANLSLDEIEIAGLALIRYYYDKKHHYALIKSRPCDPNILGLISDMMLQVDCVDTCIVYNVLTAGIKLSVRSCIKEVKASELANYLTYKIGSGGGHLEKAGGLINPHLLSQNYPDLPIETYFMNRLNDYFKSYQIIDASTYKLDIQTMQVYHKTQIPLAYIESIQIAPSGTPIIIRTFEKDIKITANDDLLILINNEGTVLPIKKEKFDTNYTVCKEVFKPLSMEYFPSIKNKLTGNIINLKPLAKSCLPKGEDKIYAKTLTQTVKVFSLTCPNTYMLGKPGDYIATHFNNPEDIYIIRKNIFIHAYTPEMDEKA